MALTLALSRSSVPRARSPGGAMGLGWAVCVVGGCGERAVPAGMLACEGGTQGRHEVLRLTALVVHQSQSPLCSP